MAVEITQKQLEKLKCLKDVDAMLLERVAPSDVAQFIQVFNRALEDVPKDALIKALEHRRDRHLKPKVEGAVSVDDAHAPPEAMEDRHDFSPVVEYGEPPRPPGRLAPGQYKRAQSGINEILELECLFLFYRDRIDWLAQMEATFNRPYGDMEREVGRAESILKTLSRVREKSQPALEKMRMSLEIRGGSALGQRFLMALEAPESRQKVLSLLHRMQEVAKLPAGDVIDGEGEPVGGP